MTQKWNVSRRRRFRLSNGAARCPFLRAARFPSVARRGLSFRPPPSLAVPRWLSVRVDQAGERSRVCLHNDVAVAGTNRILINVAFQLSKRAGKSCRYRNVYAYRSCHQQTKGIGDTRGRFRSKLRQDGCDGLLTEASLTSREGMRDWAALLARRWKHAPASNPWL